MRRKLVRGCLHACLSFCMLVVASTLLVSDASCQETPSKSELTRARGKQLFEQSCSDCHGASGQGVEGAYEVALEGDDSIGQLTQRIADTMPEGSPEDCVGEDAEAIAEYMHYAFYSEAARVRNRPPRVALSRLTGKQLRQSLADLYGKFHGLPAPTDKHGLNARYYAGDRPRRDNMKFERVDSQLDFDFGHDSPGEGIEAKEFSIEWRGGLLAEEGGSYEIVLRSTCSFMFYFGADDREFIDNHVQSGDKTEFRRRVNLTPGRVYPIRISFRQRERKTELPPARISLSWVPPGGVEQVVPAHNLIASDVPDTFALQANLPPDDSSYGYARGISVSKEWDESTTRAALEFAGIAQKELWPEYRRRHRDVTDEGRQRLRDFLAEVVGGAFRGPLSDDERKVFIDQQVDQEPDDAEAIKRVCLVALKSARFLYPTADYDRTLSQRVANRLSLILFDSLPTDRELVKLVEQQKLANVNQVRDYVEKAIDDYRVRAKTLDMLHAWLNVQHFGEIVKDEEQFAGFDSALLADMEASLNMFLTDIVWSEESDFRQLFLAKTGYTSQRMSEYYGDMWAVKGEDAGTHLQSTEPADAQFGLLTHPYLLSGLAYHDSSSPIHRGVFLIRYVLGRTLRPPADAFSPLSPDLHPDLTTRERVELQTSPASCQTCHERINGLGFALEQFDAVGQLRQAERDRPINSAGHYVDRLGERIEFQGPAELADYLANSDDARRSFVRRAFQFFVKQPPAAYGAETLDRLTDGFSENDCHIRQLLVEIAVSAVKPLLDSEGVAEDAGLASNSQ